MAVTADSVVVELVARTDGYNAAISGAAASTTSNMSKIERSAASAERQIVRSAGAMANAQRNLGRQFSDIGTQLAGGQSPFLILAQQAPQVADALADTGGRAARIASFFAGPWGAALLAAGSALAVFAEKALAGGDSIESLTAKLEANAERSRLGAQAQAIFERSLFGAAEASAELNKRLQDQNRSQLQVAQSALAAAVAQRQQNLQNLRAESSRAAIAARDAQETRDRALNNPNLTPEERAGALGAAAGYERNLTNARYRLAAANRALAESESAVVEANIPLLKIAATNASDRSAAATDRHTRAVDGLANAYRRASLEAQKFPVGDPRRTAALDRANNAYIAGGAAANRTLEAEQDAIRESERKKRGPSAETLARRAEAARIRELRDNEAAANELEQLNAQILTLKRQATVDAGASAALAREEVQVELNRKLIAIQADQDAKKYSAAQAQALREKANEVASLKNLAISTDEIRRAADEQLLSATNAVSRQSALLEAQGRVADTNEQRRAIELELLRLKYEELAIAKKAVLNDTTGRFTDAQREEAQRDLNALPGLQAAERAGVDRRYEGRFERYRREAFGADALADSIDNIKIQTLESVTDELTNATKAALGLKGAFGDIVGELIRIGIQRRLIGPLADQLFGAADGSSSGSLGGFFKGFTRLFGRASGGYVGPGQTVRVNEGRGGVELLRMGSQGGTVIPLGQANATARPRQAGMTVLQTIQVDARGAVMADSFARDILSRAGQDARQVVQQNNNTIRRGFPAAQDRFNQLGTTG